MSSPLDLSWAEVDPAAHPFDPGTVPEVVRSVAPPGPPTWEWSVAVTEALVDRWGTWVCGWRSSITGDGWWDWPSPPVRTERTLTRTAELVVEWRSWLEELAELFDRHLPIPAAPEESRATWERAFTELIVAAVGDGSDIDCWQGPCMMAARWLCEAAGVPERGQPVHDLLNELFPDWWVPTSAEIAGVAEAAARQVLVSRGSA